MTSATKDNSHILADEQAFKAAYERACREFERIDGVVAVGYGLKQKGGTFGKDIAIVVYVEQKKPFDDLPADQRIPPSFEGYPTDVRVVPTTRSSACENAARYATIQGGIQIANGGDGHVVSTGTLSCIVRKRNDSGRDNVYVLSNHHVMHALGQGVGDSIYHPRPDVSDSLRLGAVQAGGKQQDIPYAVAGASINIFVDCAIARLDLDSTCCGSTCTQDSTAFAESVIDLIQETPHDASPGSPQNAVNRIDDVKSVIGDIAFGGGAPVTKVGRATGRTQGTVVSVVAAFRSVDPHDPTIIRLQGHNCIEIQFAPTPGNPTNCKQRAAFAERGDSGSLVLDAQRRAVGIISEVPLDGAPPDQLSSLACHIVPVLDLLNICIPCRNGTQHGSSLAADGSGREPTALAPGQSTLPTGQIMFTFDAGNHDPARPRPAIAPRTVDDDELRRMRETLATFRATRLGPELHAVFA